MSSFLGKLEQIKSVRKTEVFLPIARMGALVTPLLVGDDLALKTSMMSPVNYEKEMVRLLFKHSKFLSHSKLQGEQGRFFVITTELLP